MREFIGWAGGGRVGGWGGGVPLSQRSSCSVVILGYAMKLKVLGRCYNKRYDKENHFEQCLLKWSFIGQNMT